MEKKINRQEIFTGKVIHVIKDEVELDDGSKTYREVAMHNGGVCIALKNNDEFYLVEQYRYAQGKDMLEFPAGKLEKGEKPIEAIYREAQEETGYSVKNLKEFGYIVPTGGYSSEKIYLYYGETDQYVGQHFDVDERINLKNYSFEQIKQMIKDNIIDDGKTIALMYRLEMEGLNV